MLLCLAEVLACNGLFSSVSELAGTAGDGHRPNGRDTQEKDGFLGSCGSLHESPCLAAVMLQKPCS